MTTLPDEPDAMPILHLQLGPLDLNLLGLRVELNQVVRLQAVAELNSVREQLAAQRKLRETSWL